MSPPQTIVYVRRNPSYWLKVIIFTFIVGATIVMGVREQWSISIWLPAGLVSLCYWTPLILDGLVSAGVEIVDGHFSIHSHSPVDGHDHTDLLPLDQYAGVAPVGYHFPNAVLLLKNGGRLPLHMPHSQALLIDFLIRSAMTASGHHRTE